MINKKSVFISGLAVFLVGQLCFLFQQAVLGGVISGIAVSVAVYFLTPAEKRPLVFSFFALMCMILAQWIIAQAPGYGFMLFAVSALFLVRAKAPATGTPLGSIPERSSPFLKWEPWFILLLMAVSIGLRFYHLSDLPQGAAQQEGDFLDHYLSLMANQPYMPHVPAPASMPMPSLGLYQGVLCAKWLGWNVGSFRVPSVVFSLLAILAFYFLVRRLTSPVTAAIASTLFSVSFFHLILSRIFFPYTMLFIPFLLGLGLLVIGWHRPKWYLFLMAGMAVGLSLHGYLPGRGVFMVFLAWIAWMLVFYRRQMPAFKYWLWFAAGFFIIAGPVLYYYFTQWKVSWEYTDSISPLRGKGIGVMVDYVWQMLPTALQIFHIKTPLAAQFQFMYKPLLDPFAGMIFGTGIVLCGFLFWRPIPMFFLLAFFTSLMPAILGTPFFIRRACMVLPVVFLLGAYALEYFRVTLFAGFSGKIKWLFPVLGALICAASLFETSQEFFVRFAQHPATLRAYFHPDYLAGLEMRKFPKARPVVQPLFFRQFAPVSVLFPEAVQYDRPHTLEQLLITQPAQDRLLLLEPYMETLIPFFKKEFPHLQAEVFRESRALADPSQMEYFYSLFADPNNPSVYLVRLFIPEQDWRNFADLLDISRPGDAPRAEVSAENFSETHSGKTVRLAGALLLPDGGRAQWDLPWKGWTLQLDRQNLTWGQARSLAPGIHYFTLAGTVPAGAHGPLPLRISDLGRDLISEGRMVALQQGMGMRMEYLPGQKNWENKPLLTTPLLFPLRRFYEVPGESALRLPSPLSLRLRTWLTLPKPGEYFFQVNPATPCRILVNGKSVFSSLEIPENPRYSSMEIGSQEPIRVEMECQLGVELIHDTVVLEYKGPGQNEFQKVPPEWMRLDPN